MAFSALEGKLCAEFFLSSLTFLSFFFPQDKRQKHLFARRFLDLALVQRSLNVMLCVSSWDVRGLIFNKALFVLLSVKKEQSQNAGFLPRPTHSSTYFIHTHTYIRMLFNSTHSMSVCTWVCLGEKGIKKAGPIPSFRGSFIPGCMAVNLLGLMTADPA